MQLSIILRINLAVLLRQTEAGTLFEGIPAPESFKTF